MPQALRDRGIDLVVTREPGGSDGAEKIRELLLTGDEDRWSPQAEALLFAAARTDHVDKVVQARARAGKWVLSDRFIDSSLAYQGGAGGLGIEAVRAINAFGINEWFPDRTLVLALAEGGARARARDNEGSDRIGGRPEGYHQKVDLAFRQIAAEEPRARPDSRCFGRAGRSHPAPARGDRGPACRDRRAGPRGRTIHFRLEDGAPAPCLAARRAKGRRQGDLRARGGDARARGCRRTGGRRSPASTRRRIIRIARLVEAGSHPDLRWLERLVNEKTGNLARNITVDQVRSLGDLFDLTPALSPWRAVVIDSIDDLEKSAANALLKMLEEPPANTLFFLVSHAPGRLLPTIRSRCRRLDFQALDDDAMTSVLLTAMSDREGRERERVDRGSAGGSAGRALALAAARPGDLEEAGARDPARRATGPMRADPAGIRAGQARRRPIAMRHSSRSCRR